MRKIILIAVIVISSFNSFAYPVLRRTTSGGIFGFYSDTKREVVSYGEWSNGSAKLGVIIDCSGLGFTLCPNSSVLTLPNNGRPDAVDLTEVSNFLKYVDDQIDNAIAPSSGTKVTRVRVNGENTERVYTLSWIVNKNGSTVTNIDLEEVSLY